MAGSALRGGRMLAALLTIGVVAVPAGGAAATPRSSSPAGFRRVDVARDSFSVDVPTAWLSFDFTLPAQGSRYAALQRAHPGARGLAPRLELYFPATQLYATEPGGLGRLTVALATGAAHLPSLAVYRSQFAELPTASQPVVDGLRISGHTAIRVVKPCPVTPVTPCPNATVLVVGRPGLLTFEIDAASPASGLAAPTLITSIERSIALH